MKTVTYKGERMSNVQSDENQVKQVVCPSCLEKHDSTAKANRILIKNNTSQLDIIQFLVSEVERLKGALDDIQENKGTTT